MTGCAHAEITDKDAIRIIVAVAADRDIDGMLLIADCLRNRDSVKGYEYALKYTHTDKEHAYIWTMAKLAWEISAKVDRTKGATDWKKPVEDAIYSTPQKEIPIDKEAVQSVAVQDIVTFKLVDK